MGYLDQRNNEIKNTFDQIEKSKGDITALKDKYELQLASIEKSAYEKVQSAIKEGLAVKTDIISEAHAQADKVLRKATEEIEIEKKKAIAELKTDIVNLSVKAAGKLIEKELDEKQNQKIVEQFLNEFESSNIIKGE
jgi:F-type H+-transporting ATPase subunit b